jgi:hypothetical protein
VIDNEMINFVEFESKDFYEIRRNNQVLRRKKASSDTKENCLYHYLLCKKKEFNQVSKKHVSELIAELIAQKKIYGNCNALQFNELNYLDIWINIVTDDWGQ